MASNTADNAAIPVGVWLRSLAFFLLYNTMGIGHSLLSVLVAPLLDFPGRHRFVNHWSSATMWLLEHLNGIRIEVEGRELIPTDRPLVVMVNHQSEWETFWMQLLICPQATVLKRSLLWVPFFGWALALLRPIPIDRGRGSEALKGVVRQGTARLADGVSVVIYPEGTRQPAGVIGPFNAGGAMLASRANVAILPIVHNSGDCWPARSLLRRPGTIRVRIGAPLPVAGLTPKAATRAVRDWMRANYPGVLHPDAGAGGPADDRA